MNIITRDERTIMVFLRDRERDLGTGYKTRGLWQGGAFAAEPWRSGEFACDCTRGPMLYGRGDFACGAERFPIERIVVWDTGETVYAEPEAPRQETTCHRAASGPA
jgi:hypothetical protein